MGIGIAGGGGSFDHGEVQRHVKPLSSALVSGDDARVAAVERIGARGTWPRASWRPRGCRSAGAGSPRRARPWSRSAAGSRSASRRAGCPRSSSSRRARWPCRRARGSAGSARASRTCPLTFLKYTTWRGPMRAADHHALADAVGAHGREINRRIELVRLDLHPGLVVLLVEREEAVRLLRVPSPLP